MFYSNPQSVVLEGSRERERRKKERKKKERVREFVRYPEPLKLLLNCKLQPVAGAEGVW